ncbi:MAG: helix-turn-helix transcriptional regulator [Armatimonadota bacterium]
MRYRLAEIRKEKGLTQEQLAAMVGVTRAMISLIEGEGTAAPSLRLAQKIAKALDTPMDVLFEEVA